MSLCLIHNTVLQWSRLAREIISTPACIIKKYVLSKALCDLFELINIVKRNNWFTDHSYSLEYLLKHIIKIR